MGEIDSSLLASYQMKPWSLHYFFGQALEGHALMLRELRLCFRQSWAQLFRLDKSVKDRAQDNNERQQHVPSLLLTSVSSSSSEAIKHSALFIIEGSQVDDDHKDNQSSSLKYGIIILSKLCHSIGLWIPSFALDITYDLQISKFFVIFSYVQLALFFVIGNIVAKWVLEPSLLLILGKIAPNAVQVFNMTMFFSEISYLSYGLISCGYVQYQRHFIQDFFLYRCTMINLPRAYQRRKMVILLLTLYMFAFASEPLYALLSLYYDLQQPQVWPHLSKGWFCAAKWGSIALTSFSASLLSSSSILMPLMTCFLMLASARHLKITMEKQLVRYRRLAGGISQKHHQDHSTCKRGPQPASNRLEALLDNRARKIIDDYSCQTLTMDWPELVDKRKSSENKRLRHAQDQAHTPHAAISKPNNTAKQQSPFCPTKSSLGPIYPSSSRIESNNCTTTTTTTTTTTCLVSVTSDSSQLQLSASASGLLFVYKNLLKNMSQIKQMIRLWETKFANFHLIYTLLNCLVVGQWITIAFTEARGRNMNDETGAGGSSPVARDTTDAAIAVIGSYRISPSVVRIIGGVVTFIVSNIYIILWCDCLSRRLIKIRAQLFKMNIDLTNSHVLSRGPPLAVELCDNGGCDSAASSSVIRHHHQQQQQHYATAGPVLSEYAEIDQIWSLYDQIDRLASTTLFKFSPDTYYTKRCLLVIFGRSVSVLLLFIQVLEMYSYT